jgi:hypothetical protein
MPITVSALRPADIIVSTTDAGTSAMIRAGIGSSVSHSMIYVGGPFVVEAIESGVEKRPIATALDRAVLAIALRRRNLTDKQRRALSSNRQTSSQPDTSLRRLHRIHHRRSRWQGRSAAWLAAACEGHSTAPGRAVIALVDDSTGWHRLGASGERARDFKDDR